MKTGTIIIGIVVIIVIIVIVLLYAMFVKTSFDGTIPSTTNGTMPSTTNGTTPSTTNGTMPSTTNGTTPSTTNDTMPSTTNGTTPSTTNGVVVPTTSVMTPTVPWFLQYDRYAREAGIDVDANTNPNTHPYLNTKQLRNEDVNSLMMQNANIRQRLIPDLYPVEDTLGIIAEDQAPMDNTSSVNEGAVVEQTTYDHDNSSIIGADAVKEIGTSIADIGKTITELPGEMGSKLGYAGYNVSSDYNLLPASLYNNMWDYKQSSSESSRNDNVSTGSESNVLDKMPRAILQKDFSGVSNIFAPNFIFLGKKDDYSIGFDENWQYP